VSALFPKLVRRRDNMNQIDTLELQVTEHHEVITRHGRAIHGNATNFANVHSEVVKIKSSDPLGGINERLNKVELDLAKLRTAIYIVGVLLTGGYVGGKTIERVTPNQPQVIQLAPEALKALQERP